MASFQSENRGNYQALVISQDYELEYGHDTLEIHLDSIEPGETVLLIDDLLATGGTAEAGVKLVEKLAVILCHVILL